MHIYVRMYVCIYVCMHVCMYVCMYVYTYVCMYVCICVYMYMYPYAHSVATASPSPFNVGLHYITSYYFALSCTTTSRVQGECQRRSLHEQKKKEEKICSFDTLRTCVMVLWY